MRIVRGTAEARESLCNGRGLDLNSVPPSVDRRTEEVFGRRMTPSEVVALIVEDVRERGDEALRDLARRLDGSALDRIEVSRDDVEAAAHAVRADLLEALETAGERIRAFHEASLSRGWIDFARGYGQLVNPVDRVGIYVPGGTAVYPSTALMTAIPARVAGVGEIVMCTPGKDGGRPHPAVLAAASIAGVDRVFAVGGAQATAAMAYGTETVPRVDMICGPGNVFVTLAKKHVYGDVGIDGLYGPTETLVIADDSANPTLCAADLLAQAEHDPLATPVLLTTSDHLARAVDKEVGVRLERMDRQEIARTSIEERGRIVVVDTLDEAMDLANEFAPEHLSLMVADPWSRIGAVRNAGAVFVGEFSHEVLGDYVAGPSHVMPTGGTARFGSGLGTHSFVKVSPIVALDDSTSASLSGAASSIAKAEGLTGHAEAAEVRIELLKSQEDGG